MLKYVGGKQDMSRIFVSWELGANFGHLTRLMPITEQLRQLGHELFFAVRDTEIAAALLGNHKDFHSLRHRFGTGELVCLRRRLTMPNY
jgi:hypothetical protein